MSMSNDGIRRNTVRWVMIISTGIIIIAGLGGFLGVPRYADFMVKSDAKAAHATLQNNIGRIETAIITKLDRIDGQIESLRKENSEMLRSFLKSRNRCR